MSARYLVPVLLAATIIGLIACGARKAPSAGQTLVEMRVVTDDEGRKINVPVQIDRVVSLAPNLTEIIFAVGAGSKLVGNTTYCDYPAEARNVTKVGDTLHPSIERIIAAKPQLVLVSTASQLEAFTKQLDEQRIAVYVTNPRNLDGVFASMQNVGDLLGLGDPTRGIVASMRSRTQLLQSIIKSTKPVSVFYQVSGEPLYTIGRDAYLTDLIQRAGGVSVTADVPGAFPRYSDEAAFAARPEVIILPTGGSMGNANSTIAAALKNSPAAKNGRVYKINDDLLSRPGPRLVDGLEELIKVLHAEAHK